MLDRLRFTFSVFLSLIAASLIELPINRQIILASESFVPAFQPLAVSSQSQDRARQLLERGISLYEQESFVSARDVWLKSALLFSQQQNSLGEALALNNIALARQHLGEWAQSEKAIAKSFQLLQQDNNQVNNPVYWSILAKANNTRGNYRWQMGNIELALDSWQDAAKYYARAGERQGIIKAQINQTKALQALGLTRRSVKVLETVNKSLQEEKDSQLKATGLKRLGISLRNLGRLEQSATILKQSLALSQQTRVDNSIWLELGNTYRQQRERALNIGREETAEKYFTEAIAAYQKARTADSLLLSSQLNQLSLLIEARQYAAAESMVREIEFPRDLAANRSNIYALLNYARSLTCLRSPVTTVPLCKVRHDLSREHGFNTTEIIELIQKAIALSRSSEDTIAEAQALSQLAEIYEIVGDYEAAFDYNQQGLLLLAEKSAADIAYRLEWQQGRIFKQQGKITPAINAYDRAISLLAQIRENILAIDPQVQFSFRDRIEPVYREYADLLLTNLDGESPSNSNLREAIRVINALQIAELENYLGCDLSQLIKIDETTVDTTAVQIYPIVLSDRLVTIVDIPGKPLTYRETKVSQQQIANTVLALQDNLTQPGKTPETLKQARQMYRWLVEPLETVLQNNPQLKTIVFVPDSLLRNIPLGVLYDGEQYLIERDYALVISPQLELFAPAPSPNPLTVLTGGVGISQTIEGREFPAISQVARELNQIASEMNTNNPLLDEEFTEVKIRQQLQQGDFSAIHWKTHGVFSSDPTATFLVAYQDSIKANELQSLVQTASREGQKPLELLVLSACETARGDNRAVLGLAGLTVRTGARTALSTLWRADDRATTLLMTEFYQQLQQPGITKAEALRQAQLFIMKQEGYFAPHFWGTYVLVGNWL